MVSRSTVIAARAAAHNQKKPPDPATIPGRTAVRAIAYRSARRMPPWMRRAVPAGVRAKVRDRMSGGDSRK